MLGCQMDIERLWKKRQLNVQEQNALAKQKIVECTLAYRNHKPHLKWIRMALLENDVNPENGILMEASSVPCGGGEEAAYAEWLSSDRQFFSIEATVTSDVHALVTVESFANVTADTNLGKHERGRGKSLACLALEVLEEMP